MTRAIILFDGVCNLCSASVQFIIKRDPAAYFQFASLQSEAGAKLRETYNIANDIDSIILIDKTKVYIKSSAALHICKNLGGFWRLLYLFILIPPQLRDPLYDVIAKNRYKWFGQKDTCMVPDKGIKDRFL